MRIQPVSIERGRRRSFIAVVLFLVGCQTDPTAPTGPAPNVASLAGDGTAQSCQVVRNLGQDGFLQNYRYDSQGLVSRWDDGFGTLLPQYDSRGVLVRARYVVGDIALASIGYEYSSGKVAKETWLNPVTGFVDDIIVNTWNAAGQLVRRESLSFGFFATFQYDELGNAFQVDVLATNGFLLLSNTYTFRAAVKSPELTLKGLPYGPQFLNYVFNPRRQTSAKAVISDVEGHHIVVLDQDPARSVLFAGKQNFALYQNFFDRLSGTFYSQTWTYQHCAGNNFPPDIPPSPLTLGGKRGAADFALRGPMKNVKQQIQALATKYRP